MIYYKIGLNSIWNGGLNNSVEKNVFSWLIVFRYNMYNVKWTSAQSFSYKFII